MARVLVIDDNSPFLTVAVALLRSAGHDARGAAGGVEGLRAFRAGGPDLVLCDLFMPEMDGLEVLRALSLEAPGVPVVAMSGGGSRGGLDVTQAARLMGAAAVLLKPFSPDELEAVIARALGGG